MKTFLKLPLHSNPPPFLYSAVLFFLLGVRILFGPEVEPILLLLVLGRLLFLFYSRPIPWNNPFFLVLLALGGYTLLTMLIPARISLPDGTELWITRPPWHPLLPEWAREELADPAGTLHLAPWEGLSWVVRFLGGAGIFLMVLTMEEKEAEYSERLWRIVALSLALLVLLMTLRIVTLPYLSQVNPNHLAALLLLALPTFLLHPSEKIQLCGGVVLFALLSTRAIWCSILGVSSLLLLINSRASTKYLLLLFTGILGATLLLAQTKVIPQLHTSLEHRLSIYTHTLRMISERWTIGVGFGAFAWLAPLYMKPNPTSVNIRVLYPENGFLWFLSEGGLLALLLLLIPFLLCRVDCRPQGAWARRGLLLLLFASFLDVPWLWGGLFWMIPFYLARGFKVKESLRSELPQASSLG